MSYSRIISVVNEHTASTLAARYAISLATACQAGLVLYVAQDNDSTDIQRTRAKRHLDHLYTIASDLNIQVNRIIEPGSISTLLPKRVAEDNADLVMYPMTPSEPYGDSLQRHVVHHLLRTVSSDLAVIRGVSMARPHPRHILVPFGKAISNMERRQTFVGELAKSFQAQVTLFHLSADRKRSSIPDDISSFRNQLQQMDIEVLERIGAGQISKSIIIEAITRHHDLIILGASGRGLLRRLFSGNPAGDVMQQPPCNTILFRPALSKKP